MSIGSSKPGEEQNKKQKSTLAIPADFLRASVSKGDLNALTSYMNFRTEIPESAEGGGENGNGPNINIGDSSESAEDDQAGVEHDHKEERRNSLLVKALAHEMANINGQEYLSTQALRRIAETMKIVA